MTLPTVQYIDALVGARKTSRTIDFIVSSPASDKFLIATPNTTLSKETAVKLTKAGLSVLQIDSEDGKNCTKALIDAISANEHKVIIANLNVILKLDRLYTANHHLFIDEIPNIYECFFIDGMVISKNDIRKYFSTKPTRETADFLDVFITNEGVEFLSKWRKEQVFRLDTTTDKKGKEKPSLPKTLETMWCEHYRMVIDTESHNRFIDSDGIRLTFYTLLEPSVFLGFKSVTIIGANFKDSLLYLVHEQNIRFVPHSVIKGFYDDHSHKSEKTKIYYLSNRDCSKNLLGNKEVGFQNFFDKAAEMIAKMFPNKRHIFTMNHPDLMKVNGKWVRPSPYRWALEDKTGLRVSPDPRGWNGLADYDMAIHMAALNYTPMDFHFFDDFLTISRDEAVRAMTFERIYQFLGRTSLRDYDRVYDRDEELILIVFDRQTAMRMQKMIGCGEPTFIDLGIEKLQEDKQLPYDQKAAAVGANARYRVNEAQRERLAADEATPQYEGFGARIWSTGADKEPTYQTYAIEDVFQLMERAAEQPLKFKADCSQFREGAFSDLGKPEIAGNLTSSKMLAFDIDDSNISPKEVSAYLSSLHLTHFIYNSFSHKGFPYDFHILIPLSRAVNEGNYRHIFKVVRALIEARFGKKEVPIEAKYASINKWISMPCESKFGQGFVIAKRCWKNIMTKEYSFLDVQDYLTRQVPRTPEQAKEAKAEQTPLEPADAEAIVSQFAVAAVPGNRDTAFCQAGVALRNAKVPQHEMIRVLDAHRHEFGKKSDHGAAKRLVKSITSKQSGLTAIL